MSNSFRELNILFLSSGRRVELINHFIRAREEEKVTGKIIACDISPYAPALYFADKHYIVPKVDSPDFISRLREICIEESIVLVIPLIDYDLPVLACNTAYFSDLPLKLLVSDRNIIEITQDKCITSSFFKDNNICTPQLLENNDCHYLDLVFPLVIKPRSGNSSKNVFVANNIKELDFFKYYIEDYIVQQYIAGQEYSIDIFTDFESNVISIVPRKRVSVRAGEVIQSCTVYDEDLINQVEHICKCLRPIGPITVQCIENGGKYYFIEINARFGGGAPISISAGADSPRYIYKLLRGEKLERQVGQYKRGYYASRYDSALYLEKDAYQND